MIKRIIARILRARGFSKQPFAKIGDKATVAHGFVVLHPESIEIGTSFTGGRNLLLQAWPSCDGTVNESKMRIIIGDNVSMMSNCHLSSTNSISVGNGCLFGDNVFITDNYHGNNTPESMKIPPAKRKLYSKGPVVIGANVWIGRNVCVMPGVTIGDGAVVGANAVVTHDIPAYTIAVGVPARVIQ